MILKAITLENFRSAESECIHFDPGVNLLYGNNAEGKTNVLEAIYFFARGRSFRTTRESDLVRFGAEGCGVDIAFTRRGEEETLGYRYFGGTRRRTKNGVKVTAREALGVFCAVLFCPDHLSVIKRTPAERREFLNAAIAQISPAYVAALGRHKKLLENKNALLRIDGELQRGAGGGIGGDSGRAAGLPCEALRKRHADGCRDQRRQGACHDRLQL